MSWIPASKDAEGRPFIAVAGAAMPPIDTEALVVPADNPLEITKKINPHDTLYVVPANTTAVLYSLVAGCEGDPSERGSRVDVLYDDGSEHLVTRIYVSGHTSRFDLPCLMTARDGTVLAGGGKLVVRRVRLSKATQEVDAMLRGYLKPVEG